MTAKGTLKGIVMTTIFSRTTKTTRYSLAKCLTIRHRHLFSAVASTPTSCFFLFPQVKIRRARLFLFQVKCFLPEIR